jgi:hypothetical protein
LLEGVDLPFTTDAPGIQFTIPPEPVDRVNSGEFQTHILWPGIDLRFEHGDPARRAGKYAEGPWPDVQLEAAHNLEFAQLKAIRMLGLDAYVVDQNIGTIDLMGFDTNYPHGHRDFPPHMHMILWWPTVTGAGSLIAHYRISPEGLLTDTRVIPLRAIGLRSTDFPPGKTFIDTDDEGRGIYTHTVTAEGWLHISRVGGSECLIKPLKSGFQSGASINCSGFQTHSVRVSDDLKAGVIRVSMDDKKPVLYYYDRDDGHLLSHQSR